MKISIKKIILSIVILNSMVLAWEVNTHYAIEKKALFGDNGDKNNAKNLKSFVKNNNLKDRDYSDQEFDDYGTTYFDYVIKREKMGVSSWGLNFKDAKYGSLIEAGSVLEDVVWQESVEWANTKPIPLLLAGMDYYHFIRYTKQNLALANGRFSNHFLDRQNNNEGLSLVPKYVEENALNWAKDGGKVTRGNNYSYRKAMQYFSLAFGKEGSTDKERKKYEAKLFVSVGHMLHLLNDMSVPAHTRDDSHPLGDDLEVWMRGRDRNNNPTETGFSAIGTNVLVNHIEYKEKQEQKYDNFDAYFLNTADYTGKHYYSDDSISLNSYLDLDLGSLYTNYSPTQNEVDEDEIPNFLGGFGYVKNQDGIKIAMIKWSRLYNAVGEDLKKYDKVYAMKFDGQNGVLKDSGSELISRAVSNAKNFVNYFFRGQIEAKITEDGVVVKNTSNPNTVKDANTVIFKKEYLPAANIPTINGEIQIYWDDEEGVRHALLEEPHKLSQDLAPNGEEIIDELDEEQKEKLINHHITVVYKGVIGKERSVAVDATVTKETNTTATLAFYYVYNCAGEVAGLKFKVYTTKDGESKLIHTKAFQNFFAENREPNSDWIIKDTTIFKDANIYGNAGSDKIGGWHGKVISETYTKETIQSLINKSWSPEIYRYIKVNRGGGGVGGIGQAGHMIGVGNNGDGCPLAVLNYKVQTVRMQEIKLDQSIINKILEEFNQ